MKRILGLAILLIPLVALLLIAHTATADDHPFVGSKDCKKCHLKEFKSWEGTKMAQAFEILRPGNAAEAKTKAGLDPNADYTGDAKCLACHTVGYGKPGGFTSEAETPDHLGVGCESCHGAGGSYTADDKMSLKNKEYKRADILAAGLVDTSDEATLKAVCESCHNDQSPTGASFDFAAQKDEGRHENFPLKYEH